MSQQKSVTGFTFGERLSQVMLEQNLKPAELARRTGVDRAYISMLKSGKRENPSPEVLAKIASSTCVTEKWLVSGELPKSRLEAPPSNAEIVGIESSVLRETEAKYRVPSLEATLSYRETILKLIPKFSPEQLADLAKMLQEFKPPGYALILDQVLPMLAERIPKQP